MAAPSDVLSVLTTLLRNSTNGLPDRGDAGGSGDICCRTGRRVLTAAGGALWGYGTDGLPNRGDVRGGGDIGRWASCRVRASRRLPAGC